VQLGEDMRVHRVGRVGYALERLTHARDITGPYHRLMVVSRAERVAALLALVLIVGLLVIDLDVIAGGRLLGGRAVLEDQAVSEDDGRGTGGD
jgi:hypothetical protein